MDEKDKMTTKRKEEQKNRKIDVQQVCGRRYGPNPKE
jgi:hypothetical protein